MNEKVKEWYDRGARALGSEDYEECLRCWNIVYDIYMGEKNYKQAYLIGSLIGTVNNSLEKHKEAIKCFQKALDIAKNYLDKKDIMVSLKDLARTYLSLLQYDKALYYSQRSLNIAEEINEDNVKIDVYNDIGLILMKKNRFEVSKKFFTLALNAARSSGNREQVLDSLIFLGQLFSEFGQLERSVDYYLESLKIQDELNDKNGMITILNDIGILYNSFDDQRNAWESYKQIFLIVKDLKNKDMIPLVLTGIGDMYRQWYQDNEALELYKMVLNVSQESNELDTQWLALISIGDVYLDIGKKEDSLNCYLQAKDLALKIGDKSLQLQTLLKVGRSYEESGQFKVALKFYKRALNLTKALKDIKAKCLVLETIGLILESLNKQKKALKYLFQALKGYQSIGLKKCQGDVLNYLALCYASLKQYEVGLKFAKQALIIDQEIGNKRKEAKDLETMGILLKLLNRIQEAAEYYKKSFSIMDELSSSAPSASLRISARKELYEILKDYIPILIFLNDPQTAFAYLEQCKGREMYFDYKINNYIATYNKDINLTDQELQIISKELELISEKEQTGLYSAEEIRNLRHNLLQKQQTITGKRAILQLSHWLKNPTWGTLLPDVPIRLIKNFKKEMISDWIILDFFYNDKEEELMVFCLQKDHKIVLFNHRVMTWILNDLGTLSTLIIELRRSNLVRAIILYKQLIQTLLQEKIYQDNYNHLIKMRNKLKTRSFNDRILSIKIRCLCLKVAEILLEYLKVNLYKILIPKELKDFLKESSFSYLTIIPSGVLHSLPLELIYDGDECWALKYYMTRAFNLHTLRSAIFIKQKMISPSVLIINATKEIQISKDEIFGGNDKKKYKFNRLKASADVAQELQQKFEEKGYKCEFIEESQISKNDIFNILKEGNDFTLIHYAGHAFFNTTNPNLSFLLLPEDQGLKKIYANEIPTNTKLDGHPLIILSACETGGVEIQTGDEVFGLARGFIEAGASGLLITGWPITDESAADFTKFFYENYINKIPLAQAICLARKEVYKRALESNKEIELHYFDNEVVNLHWAPFRIYGLPYY